MHRRRSRRISSPLRAAGNREEELRMLRTWEICASVAAAAALSACGGSGSSGADRPAPSKADAPARSKAAASKPRATAGLGGPRIASLPQFGRFTWRCTYPAEDPPRFVASLRAPPRGTVLGSIRVGSREPRRFRLDPSRRRSVSSGLHAQTRQVWRLWYRDKPVSRQARVELRFAHKIGCWLADFRIRQRSDAHQSGIREG